MDQVYTRPSGQDMQATLHMTITNSRGSTRERSIVQFRKDDGEVEKKIMFFTSPADVRNTSFLSFSYADGRRDDQWIYLPALGRVRRIASDKTNDSFMGSDFTYEDMGARHPSEDTHTLLREENLDGWDVYVIESTPVEPNNEYVKTRNWIIKDEWIGLRKEFIGADGSVVRRLSIESYEKIDSIWVITDMTMNNLAKNTSTRISMEDVSFNNELRDAFFSERQMSRGPRL
ncbi:MAG TPA: outer membrane lipoprotein-sorting protein [Sphaerochaetaceae bacterium]|nr:outer membrane lipoprotein-sorting protein [Sphaerochaetaceae bacterium]